MTENRTTMYLVYLTGHTISELSANGFNSAYTGLFSEPEDTWRSQLILSFNTKLKTFQSSFLIDLQLKKNPYLEFDREVEHGKNVLVIFKLTDKAKRDVTRHFWDGKYTYLAKDYKEKWFKKRTSPSEVFHTFRKHAVVWDTPRYRTMLSEELGCPIDIIGEMDSMPSYADEVLGYKEKKKEKDRAQLLIEECSAYLQKIQNTID